MITPRLSILIPFYHDDARTLLRSLDAQSVSRDAVEVLIMDDGSGDTTLTEQTQSCVDKMRLPCTLHTAPQNRGRSVTRNALQDLAKAEWVLFLDADMRVDHSDFINRYLEAIDQGQADILFGGFQVEERAQDADTDLHRVLSQSSDCLSAEDRQKAGPQFVASSNLCVRKSVLLAEPFDPGFQGWGWEDSEWAARVSERYQLVHLNNPAVHLGLETTETLLSRFASSGPNYRRFTEIHPDLAQRLPLYRIVTRLRHVPGHKLTRLPLRALVRLKRLPTRFRVIALKLWRASHYAEAMQ
jgi:hypothetical protein